MSYAKLNVVHWHIIDEESFPIEVPTYHNLWKGAYTKMDRYTVEGAYDIVNFAKMIGINIMAEVDFPGHVESWGKGYLIFGLHLIVFMLFLPFYVTLLPCLCINSLGNSSSWDEVGHVRWNHKHETFLASSSGRKILVWDISRYFFSTVTWCIAISVKNSRNECIVI
ncbi:PREDICTED: probable beta-hexosaminidase fdl [Ipomoea nil]|uniref:probable beta-hexosaminidase fdl n=1 Tax=Ipomoea nil TaxID=35883 RepID=UPI000900FDAB|nr:PREDICTED: probable beta-hexosaminidase fdl [Ipomoea nil]